MRVVICGGVIGACTAWFPARRGVDVTVEVFPRAVGQASLFAAVVMNSAKDTGTSKAFVNFLRSPEAVKVIKSKGMAPG